MTVPPLIVPSDAESAALLARLAADDAAVRRIALLDIADLEEPDLLPALVSALRDDPAAEVRLEAARVLAAWEQEEIVEALCGALLDADSDVRAAAAQSLSELKDPASGAVLRRWVERPEPFVRTAVLRALRELRFADAFDPALHALTDVTPSVRLEAVSVLGWLKDARALAPLAALATGDAETEVRRTAVGALGFAPVTHEGATAALLGALRDPAWQVREEAATTLGKLRAPAARDPLVTTLDDDYWQVRLRAVRALGQLGDISAARAVAPLLTHSISNLRKEAALALGELRDPATLPALRDALDDRDPDVRKAVRIALQQVEGAAV
ncbi:HEAT repeat domain-containing protein [Paraburkholderia sp. DHOC27]|uniref:HEAT repeat domain-containing protein n=1 Tax=Paraburkholderia sp. DHOC27 TaxID=2303330 RepID=UPI000E3D5187|nr:HEAT repeat domain-containing protein [Paraburkholderia sp. DHOC27]RFU45071.1 HEAT repeat domain-containing protein [Paraburkholderia sp. DHOC27]